jgi:putative CocE/NonD family hydrolase
LVYDSEPLGENLEVTGHPSVTLYLSVSRKDAAIFVYLEDVAPDGQVLHVTDGLLRASRRRITPGDPPFWMAGPWRAGTKDEEQLLEPGEIVELAIELYPVSHLFKRGHAVRLAIAGADADTVLAVPADGPPPVFDVRHGGARPSGVELPVVPAGSRR